MSYKAKSDKSHYKRLGDYIELVNQRNEDLAIDILLGLSISKEFIPSVANTIGTNMKRYKIVEKNQFACSIMQVRRDGKMPVAILKSHDKAIISQAYPVFKVKDESVLNPDYLMMWFKRKEFDREATFHAVGGVRGSLEWEDFMNFKLPIPSIEKQRHIVAEYNTVDNRIRINEQLNQKLEETAQAIYKHWFVDFNFPITAESCPELVSGSPKLLGQPYKSSGGKLVYNEELDKEIPEGWEVKKLGDIIESFSQKHDFKKEKLIFFNTSDILEGEFLHSNYTDIDKMPGQAKKKIKKGDILYSEIRPKNKRYALVRINSDDYVVSTKLMVLRLKTDVFTPYRLYHFLTDEKFINQLQFSAEGRSGTFPQITFEEDLENKPFIIGDKETEFYWESFLINHYDQIHSRLDENKELEQLKDLLLSKMSKVEIEKEMV